jgi:hypothetical protein
LDLRSVYYHYNGKCSPYPIRLGLCGNLQAEMRAGSVEKSWILNIFLETIGAVGNDEGS